MTQHYRMIDVGEKQITCRRAKATGTIRMAPQTMEMIRRGDSPKGNILAIAEVAGIMAAKNTANLLPLCHPLALDSVKISYEIDETAVRAICEVVCHAKTGVEMEALTGLNICLLTIYDLAKAVDPVIEISDIHLQQKEGGKTGLWTHPKYHSQASVKVAIDRSFENLRFAVATLSDRASQGVYEDLSGTVLRDYGKQRSGVEKFYQVIPDEAEALHRVLDQAIESHTDVLLLTGGTGISKRDITPEIIRERSTKELVGFGEVQRSHGARYTQSAWLSRSSAFVVGDMLVVLFPGSPKAVRQGLECVGPLIPHAVRMIRGESHHHEVKGGLK